MEGSRGFVRIGKGAAVVCAAVLVALLSFAYSNVARAAGEPTLSITLDDYSLTSSQTGTVTFSFSTTPSGFTDADIDASGASGSMSPLEATADDRVYTANFTPLPATNDPTNVIRVGMNWSDGVGTAPLGVSTSPNFTIGDSSSSSSGCPAPAVQLSSPNGGETLTGGGETDVFWTVKGCQLVSLDLLLSTDGGTSFQTVATSFNPASGYYRWTVPSINSSNAVLRLKLYGQGGVVFATDDSDGQFAISSPPAPAPTPEPSPAPPPPPPAPAPTPAPDPTPTPTSTSEPVPAPAPAPAATPQPAPATTAAAPSSATKPTAAPRTTSSAPSPEPSMLSGTQNALAQETPTSEIPEPVTVVTPTTDPHFQPTSASTVSLDGVQGAIETASEFAPRSLDPLFTFVLGAFTMLAFMLGVQEAIKRNKAKSSKRCMHCQGTGEEPKKEEAMEKCDECDGTGQVEDEDEPAVECKHCDGGGEDPCHVCKGDGTTASGEVCPACKGGGMTLTGRQDKDGEDEVADCEICQGEGEVSATIKKMVACDKCSGTGKV